MSNDLEGLTIVLGSNFAKTVTDKCTSLLQSEKDIKIRAVLGSCSGAYDLVNLDFDNIIVAFQYGISIVQQGENAKIAVLKCNRRNWHPLLQTTIIICCTSFGLSLLMQCTDMIKFLIYSLITVEFQ